MAPSTKKKRNRNRRSPSESPLRAKRDRSKAESTEPSENQVPEESSSSALPVKVEWPPKSELWKVIGDRASREYLRSQQSFSRYQLAVKVFAARLSLLVRGLSRDQIIFICRATAPAWYETAERANRDKVTEAFEDAVVWTETKLVQKMRFYARMCTVVQGCCRGKRRAA